MLLEINKFLSSDDVSLKVNENFTINDEEFLKEARLDKNVLITGEIYKIKDSLTFSGKLEYVITVECARCLKEFDKKIETKFLADLVEEEDMESDNLQMVITDGTIKMDEAIKQLIYLSMPMKSLCRDDCKGICPNCGVNLNEETCQCENSITDPRFDKLKDLLK
ncbi:MAG TPA: DUF177 domain-containing protein [Sedimentibacter sp.]|nr:DUF177 domain-containing protein [Sedimentibacter sp.]HOW23561.1 DUF177 domain-containing protein [Sedimentibacter sp.]